MKIHFRTTTQGLCNKQSKTGIQRSNKWRKRQLDDVRASGSL